MFCDSMKKFKMNNGEAVSRKGCRIIYGIIFERIFVNLFTFCIFKLIHLNVNQIDDIFIIRNSKNFY